MKALNPLTWRQAQALIRHAVRQRLHGFRGHDIWNTSFFLDRIDLSGAAFEYQDARKSGGERVEVDELLDVVRDEFRDFILIEDVHNTVRLSDTIELQCEVCREYYLLTTYVACPHCGHSNVFQETELKLIALAEKVDPQLHDPFVRRVYDGIERWRIESAYRELVSIFEFFMKRLDWELLNKRKDAAKQPGKSYFQNLERAENRFREKHGLEILSALPSAERDYLRMVFSKRHVLEHNGGYIDEAHATQMQLDMKEIGSPLKTNKSEVMTAVFLVQKIVDSLRTGID